MKRFGLFTTFFMVLGARASQDYFYNGTSTLLEVSSAIEVELYTSEETPKFLSLIKLPIANHSKVDGVSRENANKTGITNTLKMTFNKNFNSTANTTISKVVLNFTISLLKSTGYWKVDNISIEYDIKVADKSYKAKRQTIVAAPTPGFTSSPSDLNCQRDYTSCAPAGLSWTCDGQKFSSKNSSGEEAGITLNFPGLALQPFFVAKNGSTSKFSFGSSWDCDPLIPSALWATIFIGLGLIYVIYWAVAMVSAVFTPDRFCDPKKPQIQIGQTE